VDRNNGQDVAVKNDGKALVRLTAGLWTQDSHCDLAGGHRIEVISDDPRVEILTSTRVGHQAWEAVPTRWTGPDRTLECNVEKEMFFWARSKDNSEPPTGQMPFSILVDGIWQESTNVNFTD